MWIHSSEYLSDVSSFATPTATGLTFTTPVATGLCNNLLIVLPQVSSYLPPIVHTGQGVWSEIIFISILVLKTFKQLPFSFLLLPPV